MADIIHWHLRVNGQDGIDSEDAMLAEIAELRAALAAATAPQQPVQDKPAALTEAVGKLIKAKGRFHTEQNYAAVVAAYDAAILAAAPAPDTGGADGKG